MVIFYWKWKKYNKIQLTKNKIDLNNRKMKNHPPTTRTADVNLFAQFRIEGEDEDIGALICIILIFYLIQ